MEWQLVPARSREEKCTAIMSFGRYTSRFSTPLHPRTLQLPPPPPPLPIVGVGNFEKTMFWSHLREIFLAEIGEDELAPMLLRRSIRGSRGGRPGQLS